MRVGAFFCTLTARPFLLRGILRVDFLYSKSGVRPHLSSAYRHLACLILLKFPVTPSKRKTDNSKHISWYCVRLAFFNNGANTKGIAILLGHIGLKHTEKYTRSVYKLKYKAINSLPGLKI